MKLPAARILTVWLCGLAAGAALAICLARASGGDRSADSSRAAAADAMPSRTATRTGDRTGISAEKLQHLADIALNRDRTQEETRELIRALHRNPALINQIWTQWEEIPKEDRYGFLDFLLLRIAKENPPALASILEAIRFSLSGWQPPSRILLTAVETDPVRMLDLSLLREDWEESLQAHIRHQALESRAGALAILERLAPGEELPGDEFRTMWDTLRYSPGSLPSGFTERPEFVRLQQDLARDAAARNAATAAASPAERGGLDQSEDMTVPPTDLDDINWRLGVSRDSPAGYERMMAEAARLPSYDLPRHLESILASTPEDTMAAGLVMEALKTGTSPSRMLEYLQKFPPGTQREMAVRMAFTKWVADDPSSLPTLLPLASGHPALQERLRELAEEASTR